MQFTDHSSAHLTETSEGTTAQTPWKHPKGRPRRPRSTAQRTEASVRYVILRPLCGTAHGRFRKTGRQSDICGTAHGNIRKLCRKMRTSRPDSWKHPRNRPQNRGCMPQPVAHLPICVNGTAHGNIRKLCRKMRTSRPDSWKHPRNRPQNRGCMPQPVAHLPICVKRVK